jgi:hypothetical protein
MTKGACLYPVMTFVLKLVIDFILTNGFQNIIKALLQISN